jgi:uncharacterized protein YndB with AHSA1/START domain
MLKITALVIAALIAAVLLYAATRPDSFRVERATTIQAPPEKVFAHINDLRRWEAWSPWEKKDPGMKRRFSAVTSGPGAVYGWEGNHEVGHGSMEIVESVAPTRVAIRLDFIKPFEAHNLVDFALEPQDNATRVTWSMHGPVPYLARIVHLFLDMDRMVGGDFEAGLAGLKAVAER